MISTYEEQYLEAIRYILKHGSWEFNDRTQTRCLTIPKLILEYKLDEKSAPLLTTRPSYPVSAIAEILGYLRRYQWADQFAAIGSPTWFTNANETEAWLNNPNRKCENHLGKVYGAALPVEAIHQVLRNINNGYDDRGLVLNFWQPEAFAQSCLRPCMNQHNFNFVGNKTYLTSTQRSCDFMCGQPFNALQVYGLGMVAASLSGKEGGEATHVMNNVHIYEDHLEGVEELLSRTPKDLDATFKINTEVLTNYMELLTDRHARDYFTIEGYKGVPQDKIPFKLIA